MEDIKAARYKATIHKSLERIQEQLRDLPTIIEFLEHPKTREFFAQIKTSGFLKTKEETERLDKLVTNLIACLKSPLESDPSPELAAAIERHAITKGRLVRGDILPDKAGIVIEISDLEMGKWFFPLHFIRQSLPNLDMLQNPPLRALFEPPYYLGYPKSICLEAADGQLTLTAYPKPVDLDSIQTGTPQQLKEVTVDGSSSYAKFEYWPNGVREPKFVVEVNLDNHVHLKFQEKGNAGSASLCLELSYTEGRT